MRRGSGQSGLRRSGPPRIDRSAQAEIGQRLRAVYDGLMAEPVPEHLADLVRRLGGEPDRPRARHKEKR